MARQTTARLRFNPPLGRLPVLQYLGPGELEIDPAYQRSVEGEASQKLIRRIAQHWNWDLCQPLVVAARPDGSRMVIDGQHRLVAARMRGDIAQLPCQVVHYASAADEAASFVHLNQLRRPLTRVELFKAAVASEDPESCAILTAMERAGLSIAPHTNYTAWKPGMVANIGGIVRSWRRNGPQATAHALQVLGKAYPREALQFAGTIFPGIAAICAEYPAGDLAVLRDMVAGRTQKAWRAAVLRAKSADTSLNFERASAAVLGAHWRRLPGYSGLTIDESLFVKGRAWCDQCEMRVSRAEGVSCRSPHCKVKAPAARVAA